MKRLLLLPLLIIFIGCYNIKKAEKQLNKANEKFPELVAEKTKKWYPCKEVEIKTDSSAYKKWLAVIDSILQSGKDTVIVTDVDTLEITTPGDCSKFKNTIAALSSQLDKANKTINLIKNKVTIAPAVHDTIIKIDSASIFSLLKKNEQLTKEKEDAHKEKDKYIKKYNNSLIFAISLLIALIISIILNLIKYRK